MKKEQKFTTAAYEAPEVEILNFAVENGFNGSNTGETPEEDDDIIDF